MAVNFAIYRMVPAVAQTCASIVDQIQGTQLLLSYSINPLL